MKFRAKDGGEIREAVQLTWQTWNQICDFCDVSEFEDGRPQCVYVKRLSNIDVVNGHKINYWIEANGDSLDIGLKIPIRYFNEEGIEEIEGVEPPDNTNFVIEGPDAWIFRGEEDFGIFPHYMEDGFWLGAKTEFFGLPQAIVDKYYEGVK